MNIMISTEVLSHRTTSHAIEDVRLVFIIGDVDWHSDWQSFENGKPDAEAAVAKERRQPEYRRIEPFDAYDVPARKTSRLQRLCPLRKESKAAIKIFVTTT